VSETRPRRLQGELAELFCFFLRERDRERERERERERYTHTHSYFVITQPTYIHTQVLLSYPHNPRTSTRKFFSLIHIDTPITSTSMCGDDADLASMGVGGGWLSEGKRCFGVPPPSLNLGKD